MRVPLWRRLADVAVFSMTQLAGALAVLYPKYWPVMVAVFMLCRASSLWLRPWRDES